MDNPIKENMKSESTQETIQKNTTTINLEEATRSALRFIKPKTEPTKSLLRETLLISCFTVRQSLSVLLYPQPWLMICFERNRVNTILMRQQKAKGTEPARNISMPLGILSSYLTKRTKAGSLREWTWFSQKY